MHPQAYRFVARALTDREIAGAHVVEIGALDVNATAQGLSPRELCAGAASYIGVDCRKGPGVDLAKRAQDLTRADLPHPADLVICCEVLEHERDPGGVIAAADRILAPGGALILTAAGPGREPHGVDGGAVGDEPYGNISRAELKGWLERWADVEIKEDHGAHDIYAVATKAGGKASKKER